MKNNIKHIIKQILLEQKDFLLREEFDSGSAFEFIRQKEGRALPREYVLSVLKKGDISKLSIPEDLGDDKELWQIYKFVHAPETLTKEDLHVEDLNLAGCTSLQSLPEGLSVGEYLYLNGCTSLKELPGWLSVGGSLDLGGCISLRELPKGLSVGGSLFLNGCTSLQSLPEGLSVVGSLGLIGCTSLKQLPRGLSVGWSLFLDGCTSLRELPGGLSVGGWLQFKTTDPIPQRFGGDKNAIRKYIEQELGGEVKEEILIKK